MTFRQRFLSSSQVSEWTTGPGVTLPSLVIPAVVLPPEIIRTNTTSNIVGGTAGIFIDTGTMVAGDLVVVFSAHSNGGGAAQNPTATGLTFTQVHAAVSGTFSVNVSVAVAPDATLRTVKVFTSDSAAAILYGAVSVIRNLTTVSAAGAGVGFAATATPSAASVSPASAGLAMAYMVAANYPSYSSNPTLTQAGWTQHASFRQESWGGMCVGSKIVAAGATGTVAFAQSLSSPGMSGSFALS